MKRKLVSCILVLFMVTGLQPGFSVFADGEALRADKTSVSLGSDETEFDIILRVPSNVTPAFNGINITVSSNRTIDLVDYEFHSPYSSGITLVEKTNITDRTRNAYGITVGNTDAVYSSSGNFITLTYSATASGTIDITSIEFLRRGGVEKVKASDIAITVTKAGSSGGNNGGDPDPTDPGTTDPGTTDPGTTDPGTTDPGTTDPGTTDPGTTDPGTPGTSSPGGKTSGGGSGTTTTGTTGTSDTEEQVQTLGSFADVRTTAWYYEAVKYVTENSLMVGLSDTEFGPAASMTRGMFVTILGRAAEQMGFTTTGYTNPFADVPASQYYNQYVAWAAANDIVAGYNDSSFAPNENITREQIASIFIRYADFAGIQLNTGASKTFTDSASISSWAAESVNRAVAAGLISGDDVGTFRPLDTANRAEVASIIKIFMETYGDSVGTATDGDDSSSTDGTDTADGEDEGDDNEDSSTSDEGSGNTAE